MGNRFLIFLPILASLAALAGAPAAAQVVPLANMGMETPSAGDNIPEWSSGRDGAYRVRRDTDRPFEGTASARIESTGAPNAAEPFGTIMRMIDATPYRGKRIRFRGAVRTEGVEAASVGLWLRVDRAQGLGFFDNMHDRPIRSPDWQHFEIVGDVAPDATRIVLGLLMEGPGKAWLDDASVTVTGEASAAPGGGTPGSVAGPVHAAMVAGDMPARPLSARGMANLTALGRAYGYLAHFDATDQAAAADWPMVAIAAVERVEPSRDAAGLARALNMVLRPHAPDFCAYAAGGEAACPVPARPQEAVGALSWRHEGRGISPNTPYKSARVPGEAVSADQVRTVDLGGGVLAHIALAAWVDAHGKTLAKAPAPLALARPEGWEPSGFDRSTRLADAVVAWNLFQHFYPYFDVVKVDWPAELPRALATAATDRDDRAFEATLKRMVHRLQDGHGNVFYGMPPQGQLPLSWDWIEDRLVVTGIAPGGAGGIEPGDVIEAIGGVPAAQRVAEETETWSGTERWRRSRALFALVRGAPGQTETLAWSRPGSTGTATLAFGALSAEPRPGSIAEIRPGIFYVDPARADTSEIEAAGARLAAARGVIFDLRGYPKGAPLFLQHIAAARFESMPMRIPVVTRPDREGWTWSESKWDMQPLAPRFGGRIVFLTDARAISYAESVLQTVKGARLGTIVGGPTAGANGNVNPVPLPGGYVLLWTGMQVLGADGSVHHTVGVIPDVPMTRTIAGVRAGRDELLEKGIALVEGGATTAATP